MTDTKPIRRIAIIGTGVIGASWSALYLAKGLQVVATDVAPNAEAALRKFVETAWPALKRLGLSPGASQSNLKFTAALAQAVDGVDLVQENGPERIEFKQKLYGQLDELLAPDVIIASSSSGLTMSEIQKGAASHPERCVIAHPFNPPHLIPLTEIVGGAKTSEATIRRATEFYTSIGQRTVRLNKEMPGHVANRLQAALSREVYYLVAEGVVSAADVDTAGPATEMVEHHVAHDTPTQALAPAEGRVNIASAHDALGNEVIDLARQRGLQPVGDMARHFLIEAHRPLSDRRVKFRCAPDCLFGGLGSADDFDQRDQVRRIEWMGNDTTLGMCRGALLDFAHGEPRRTRCDDYVGSEQLVELSIEFLLEINPLGPVFLDEVGVRQRFGEVAGELQPRLRRAGREAQAGKCRPGACHESPKPGFRVGRRVSRHDIQSLGEE